MRRQVLRRRNQDWTRERENTLRILTIVCAVWCVAWLDPVRDRINEGNRLFKERKFDEAISAYGEVLVDNPSDPLLNFNMGAAHYKAGKYAEALASFSRIPETSDASQRAAHAAYNAGNAQYQLGAAAETRHPQEALSAYEAALASYRRALGADPTDQDAKFNYEFVHKKMEDLKERMKQQQDGQSQQNQQNQQQQQGQQNQQNQQDQAGNRQQDEQQNQQDHPNQQQNPEHNQEQDQQQSARTDQQQDKPDGGDNRQPSAMPDDGKSSDMSQAEASALIDAAKNEELRPDEFIRQAQGGVVTEPLEDW